MKKYSKKIRKIVEDPKSEICGKISKNKRKVEKPYILLYRCKDNKWFNYSKEWKVWSEFKNKSDRDHEFDKCKRSYTFWEWDIRDDIDGAYGVTGNITDCESVVESSSLSGHPKN